MKHIFLDEIQGGVGGASSTYQFQPPDSSERIPQHSQ